MLGTRTFVLAALAVLLFSSTFAPVQAQGLLFQYPKLEPEILLNDAATVTPTFDSAAFRDPQYVASFMSNGSASSAAIVVTLQVSMSKDGPWVTPYGNDGNALPALTGSITSANDFGGAVSTSKLSSWAWGRLHYAVTTAGYPLAKDGITLYRVKR